MQITAFARRRWPALVALAAGLSMGLTACDDDPFSFDWADTPDTVLLYSLARPELNLVSAFNFFERRAVQVEAATSTGFWDAAVDTRNGQIVLLPPGAFGIVSEAGIAELAGLTLSDVTEAPSDTTAYVEDGAVPVQLGNVYVVKTNRQANGPFGARCVYYAKVSAINADPAGGTLTFEYVTNPVCNDRDLVPPD